MPEMEWMEWDKQKWQVLMRLQFSFLPLSLLPSLFLSLSPSESNVNPLALTRVHTPHSSYSINVNTAVCIF